MSELESPKPASRFHWRRRMFQGIVLGVALLFAMSLMGKRPENLGTVGGKLGPCPDSPNCVSTTADNDSQRMESLTFQGDPAQAMAALIRVVNQLPRSRVVAQTETYLLVEFTSAVFRFVDDVEFLLDVENRKIDFRSASRVGYSDMGANRKRMAKIAKQFNSTQTSGAGE